MLLVVTLASGAGCSNVQWSDLNPLQATTATGKALPRSEQGLLAYYNYLDTLHTTQLHSEFALAKQEFHKNGSDFNRLRLVTVMLHPNSPDRNLPKTRALLQEYLKIGPDKSAVNITSDRNSLAQKGKYTTLALFLLNCLDHSQVIEAENSIMRSKLEQLKAIESEMNKPDANRPDS